LGFERVGITSAEPVARAEKFLKQWIADGRAGQMTYMERGPERRARPAELLRGAKSVIAMAMNYAQPSPRPSPKKGEGEYGPSPALGEGGDSSDEGKISRYAHGKDYHKVIGKKLEALTRYLEALAPGVRCKTFVDTGPMLERAFAQRAGLGFVGKNTLLITRGLGSWVFLASVITTLELREDTADERSCGTCRLCIDACPTQAITAPYTLDARRCIAYLTIEQKESIPEDYRDKLNGWIFGCDICQEVCPHNSASPRPSPIGRGGRSTGEAEHINLLEILTISSDAEFQARFAGTAFMRAGRHGLIRNACVAAANLKRQDLIPQLEVLSRRDSHPVVREQAAWALQQLCQIQAVNPAV
jgi:epoxyqueuosine reductase